MDRGDGQRGAMTRAGGGAMSRTGPGGGMTRWDPWQEMQEMRNRMDDLFSRFFGPSSLTSGWNWGGWLSPRTQNEPDVDVYDNGKEYLVHAALPGVRPEDIHVEATEDGVHLTCECRSPFEEEEQPQAEGERKQPTPLRQSRYAYQSRFEFSYDFPEQVKPDEIKADFRNGRLELRIPKAQEERRARQIPIQVASSEGQPAGQQPTRARAKAA